MECERANAQAEAVYRLRAALIVNTDARDEVRWACYLQSVSALALCPENQLAAVLRRRGKAIVLYEADFHQGAAFHPLVENRCRPSVR